MRLKLTCLTLLFLSLTFIVFGKKPPKNLHHLSVIDKNFVQISDKLYACKFETTNLDYVTFLNDVVGRTKPQIFNTLLPDTTGWRMPNTYNEPYVKYYLRHQAYANYPSVNNSYEQASVYCAWLTQKYNENPKRKFKKVVFRLPSKEEWIKAAIDTNKNYIFPWGYTLTNKLDNQINYNPIAQDCIRRQMPLKTKLQTEFTYDSAYLNKQKIEHNKLIVDCLGHESGTTGFQSNSYLYTAPVDIKTLIQNKKGFYNLCGNVSEMLNDRGKTMGGNFLSTGYYLRTDAEDEFGGNFTPCPLVGFRVFMEVLEN